MKTLSRVPEQGAGIEVLLLRPLLHMRRIDLLAWAQAHGLAWREDETNARADRPRTILRHKVIPELLRINPNLLAVLDAAATRDALTHAAQHERAAILYRSVLVEEEAGQRVILSLPAMSALQPAQRIIALGAALHTTFAEHAVHGFAQREAIAARIRARLPAGGPYALAGNLVWTVLARTRNAPARVSIHRKDVLPITPDCPWLSEAWRTASGSLPLPNSLATGDWLFEAEVLTSHAKPCVATPWESYLDADRLGEPVLTTIQAGMRIAPLGMDGRRRLLGDILTDNKVPSALRAGWPVVLDAASGRVLWLCGLVVSHHAAITPATQRVLHLYWRRSPKSTEIGAEQTTNADRKQPAGRSRMKPK